MSGAFPRSHREATSLKMLGDDMAGLFEIPDPLDSPRDSLFASALPPERPTDPSWSHVYPGVTGCTPVTRHRVPFFMIKYFLKK